MLTFQEFLEKEPLEALSESSLSRIFKHYKEHDSGTISAFRYAEDCGDGKTYSLEENRNRNAKLKSTLLAKGYGVTKIKGVYIENYGSDKAVEVQEESFVVVDINDTGKLEQDLKALGKYFEQDSITFSEKEGEYYIIGTGKCSTSYPVYGEKIKLGQPLFGSNGEFHSKINGRPFVFTSVVKNELEVLSDHTPTEIRGIKELSESVLNELNELSALNDISEETTSGDIATVPSRIGKMERREKASELKELEGEFKEPKKGKRRHHHAHW